MTIGTYLDDLQAEMEASVRTVDQMRSRAAALREDLLEKHLGQAAAIGALRHRAMELTASIAAQRSTLARLRHELTNWRRQLRGTSSS